MRERYVFKPEMSWKHDAEVEAARLMAGWKEFHAACAKRQLYFDHIEKQGRSYVAVALIGSGQAYKASEERGKTPIEALTAAYRAASYPVTDAEPWLAMLTDGPPAVEDYDMEDLLG